MTSEPVISVVVPAYRRPRQTSDLIRSFRHQGYASAELVVVDDGVDDREVELVVNEHAAKDSRVRHVRNAANLGYCRNFVHALDVARGRYIVVLGDDDLLARPDALERYVDVFERHPDVGFVYSNLLQFNSAYEVDYVFRHFEDDTYFAAGLPSLSSTWLKSCYIPGIGLRNRADWRSLYPSDEMLFPQVELIGKVVMSEASFGIADYLVAGRAHTEQLGFAAVRGDRTKGDEKHSVEELGLILDRVRRYARNDLQDDLPPSVDDVVHTFFRQAHATIFPTEKVNNGNRRILRTFSRAVRNDPRALVDARFVAYFLVALVLPRRVLYSIKEARKRQLVRTKFAQAEECFDAFARKIGVKGDS